MGERLLSSISDRLARDRDACDVERITATRQLEAAKARSEELHQELRACEADKSAAQKAACDAHARARVAKEALALVEQQSAVAGAVLIHKEAQLSEYSECSYLLQQEVRELEERQKRIIEEARHEASSLKCEVERLRKDSGQHASLRKQVEHARHEAIAFQGALEIARNHTSAIILERDNLQSEFDATRQRLFDMESETSSLRAKADLADASANRAIAQVEKLQRALKEAVNSKAPIDSSQLRTEVVVEANKPSLTLKGASALLKTPEASHTEHVDKTWAGKQCVGTKLPSTAFACLAQRDHVQSAPSVRERSQTSELVTATIAPIMGERSRANELVSPNAMPVLGESRAFQLATQTVARIAAERRRASEPPMSNAVQIERSQASEHVIRSIAQPRDQMHNRDSLQKGSALHPTLHRAKSRLWRPGVNGSAKMKKRKRGSIFRDDLEKVGYTPGCGACRAVMSNEVQPHGHTDTCRARVYAEMVRLKLPGARRLRDAEDWIVDEDPKRPRICGSLKAPADGVQPQAQVTQSNRCIVAVARAFARS